MTEGRISVQERREFHRWQCGIPCRFVWKDGDFEAALENLSFNGAMVTGVKQSPTPSEEVLLRLESPKGEVSVPATVVFARNGAFGIQFRGSRDDRIRALMPLFMDHLERQGLA